ncbi:MAG: HlyD family efflux transporter periplasmic adaptor subunit [Lachnospiraceae bacterium]
MAKTDIIKFRKRKDVNIGIIIFLFIAIYVIINVYIFFTKSQIPIYEVQTGSIYSSVQKTGVILREEKLFTTNIAGYINYYLREGSRVAKNATIYSIDSNRDMYDLLSGDISELKLKTEDIEKMKRLLQKEFAGEVNGRTLQDTKAEILSTYQRILDETLMEELNDIVKATGITSNFHVVHSEDSGIISYVSDAYTNLTEEQVTVSLFEEDYAAESLYTIDLVAANSNVYKLIYGDDWSIVVLLDEALYLQLSGQDTVTFTIGDEKKQITAPVTCYQKDNAYFATITMSKYLANYTSERFLKLTFEVTSVEGLKIPETSITFKDYYRIPDAYFVKGGNSGESGLMLEEFNQETGEKQYTFFQPEVFYSADGFTYVDTSQLSEHTYIVTQDLTVRTMLYTFINKLEGAYNINKGYAVFRRVERLKTENGYCIVKKNSTAGLSPYDHIALDASGVTEGAVIY